MNWEKVRLGDLITESRIPSKKPDANRRIKVRLKVLGVEKRPLENEIKGATKQFIRYAGQFIYGKQNFHKGAFGIIPPELDGYETSADLPAFDVNEKCLPEWIFYFFKQGGFYLELATMARGVATQRIHPEQIYDLEVPLPDIETQKKIILKINGIEKKIQKLNCEISFQLTQIENLNQAILQEAVQGKLLSEPGFIGLKDEQDLEEIKNHSNHINQKNHSSDTGHELLKRIKAEKQKSGKKEKPLPPIKPEEIPFEIPEDWVWCKIGDISRSIVPNRDKPKTFSGDIIWITQSNFSDHSFKLDYNLNGIGLSVEEVKKYNCRVMPKGSVVMSCVGQFDLVCLVEREIVANQQLHCFVPFGNIEPMYLCYSLKIFSKLMEKEAIHTTIKYINKTKCESILLPLPPLSEQKLIVAEIEKQFSKTKQLKEHIIANQQATEQLLKALLHGAFEVEEK